MDIEQRKQTIAIVVVVAILAVLGFLIWRYFVPATPSKILPAGTPTTGRVPGQLPTPSPSAAVQVPIETKPGETVTTASGQILTRITDFAVIAPSLTSAEDKIQFYKKDGGDLFTSDFTGHTLEKISNLTIVGLIEALWSPRRDRAAVFYVDGEDLKGFIHVGTSSIAVLPSKTADFSWSPDGRSIAYLIPAPTGVALVTANASGKNGRTAATTPIADASIRWASVDSILFTTAASGLAEGYVFSFSPNRGEFKRLLGPLYGLLSLPSPDGSQLLISATTNGGGNMTMSLLTTATKNTITLPFQTLPEKCTFTVDSRFIYCAVPRELPSDIIWPDSYLRGEVHTSDRIIAFDIAKKTAQTIFDDRTFDIADLGTTKKQDHLFFVDRNDGALWGLQLIK